MDIFKICLEERRLVDIALRDKAFNIAEDLK